MIHDSYATHAADMGKLNRILRDEFVKMYRENDWLQELWKSLKEQTGGGLQGEALPLIGDFDLESVKDAKYFFA